MGRHYGPGLMPRSSTTDAAAIGASGPPHGAHSAAFAYNPKLEYDENEDALGEVDLISRNGFGEDSSQQKLDRESGPSSGTSTKRKRSLKLTPSQRERKRAIDREAQRSIRIKTKNYIAHLENLVKVMEQSDTTGPGGENSRTRELMNQLKQSQDEVRSLREAMLGVQRTLSVVLGDSNALSFDYAGPSSHSASPPSVAEPQTSTNTNGPVPIPSQSSTNHIPPPPPPHRKPSTISVPALPLPAEIPPPIPLPERSKTDPPRPRVEGELFYYAEYHLNRVYAAGPSAIGDTALDEDIPVRAVIEGWAAVEEHHPLDLAWRVIREIDQAVWADCGIVERMAIIRFMRTKLLHQINSRAAAPLPIMPAFMTQEVVKHARHADIIDHFIWPGFRHCLVEQPEKYISNHFGDKFRYNLKFLWPFGISSAYTKDPITQKYSSTAEFASRQWDIRCWTMRSRFFNGSEELTSCIPTFEVPLHKALTLPTAGGIGMDQMRSHHARGMVEEQEADDGETVGDSNGMHVNSVAHNGVGGAGGEMGVGGWHSMSLSQSVQQFWNTCSVNMTGMDQSLMNGLGSHTGAGYQM